MTKTFVLFAVTFSTFLAVSLAGQSNGGCQIQEHRATTTEGKIVQIICGERTITIALEDEELQSGLKVTGKHGRVLLGMEYHKETDDMSIIVDGERFDVKDATSEDREMVEFGRLLEDPEFEFFHDAAKLVHDQLQWKGRESPAVMFLYRVGIAATTYHAEKTAALTLFGSHFSCVDRRLYDYHGTKPKDVCQYNGNRTEDVGQNLEEFITNDQCFGLCGNSCVCWWHVCGDCCIHHGCKRHDEFCSGSWGYFSFWCLSARGVLWDTETGTPGDC